MRCALLLVFLSACGLRSVPGGSGGGSGGGTAGSGGGGTGQGTYQYAPATLDDSADAGRVMAISGGSGNLVAVSQFGKLYQSTDGNRFTRVLDLQQNLLSLYAAPDGALFLSAGADLAVCRAPPCTTRATFDFTRPPGTAADTTFYGLCGDSSTNVYAVGLRGTFAAEGVVVHWNGTGWSAESLLGITNVRACWLESSAVLWAAGMGQVTRWANGVGTAQGADLGPLGNLGSAQQWFALTGVAGELHVAGWSESIMSRSKTGTWTLTLNHSDDQLALWFRAVAGLRASEVFVAGVNPTGPPMNEVWRWDGSAWSIAPSLPLLGEVRSALAVPPNDLYFGGQAMGTGDVAAIIRVTRQ